MAGDILGAHTCMCSYHSRDGTPFPGADNNELGGPIPNNFDTTSPLKIFTALNNNLEGALPDSMGELLLLEARNDLNPVSLRLTRISVF